MLQRGYISSVFRNYLNKITDSYLRSKSQNTMPVVGIDKDLINLIRDIDKGFYVIEAHTGSGKTTLGLTLYQMSRIYPEKFKYKVTYINLRELRESLGDVNDEDLVKMIETVIIKPVDSSEKFSNSVYTTVNDNFSSNSFKDLLDELFEKNVYYMVILDEIERGFKEETAINELIDWAAEIREFHNKRGVNYLKIVLLLAKVRHLRELIEDGLKGRGEHVYVYSEIRSLKINSDILRDYLNKLNEHFRREFRGKIRVNLIGDIIFCEDSHKKTRRKKSKKNTSLVDLIKYLELMENGRYIFPVLRRIISDAIEYLILSEHKAARGRKQWDIDTIVTLLASSARCLESSQIDIEEYIDPVIRSIAKGRYYGGIEERRRVIEMWAKGLKNVLERRFRKVSQIEKRMNLFIYQIDPNRFIWLTLKKRVRRTDYDKVAGIISKTIGTESYVRASKSVRKGRASKRRSSVLNEVTVIVLKPESTNIFMVESLTRYGINVEFKVVDLDLQELLSIAALNRDVKNINIDLTIAETIVEELISRIESMF